MTDRYRMLKQVQALPPGTWVSTDNKTTQILRTANAMAPMPLGPTSEMWWRTHNLINQLNFMLRNSPNPDQLDVPF